MPPPRILQASLDVRSLAPVLEIRVLGGFSLEAEGTLVTLPTRKAQALIAYLACTPGPARTREQLAALLWGEHGRLQAQRSLRQALFGIRRALPSSGQSALLSDTGSLGLNPAAVSVDAVRFEHALRVETCETLAAAARLYAGPLLEGIELDEPAFKEWLLAERKRLHALALRGLVQLAELREARGEVDRAIEATLHALRLEPHAEPQRRALMRLYARHGRRGAALEHYEAWMRAAHAEGTPEPEAETQRLYREIADGLFENNEGSAFPLQVAATEHALVPTAAAIEHAVAAPRFVGRAAELDRLGALFESASGDEPRVLVVLGDAGVGKSRLLEEIALRVEGRGARVVRGRCFESERVLPLSMWADVLQGNPSLLDDEPADAFSPAQRTELARLAPVESGWEASSAPPGDILRLFGAVRSVFERASRRGPLLLLLDDLQWADDLSLRLLSFVVRRMPARTGFSIASSVRREELAETPFLLSTLAEIERAGRLERVGLEPLSESETASLVRVLQTDSTRSPGFDLTPRIWAMSEGNPFVVLESFRVLSAQDAPALAGELPNRVREFIAARFRRQSALARELIGVAAVIGRRFEYPLLERASGRPASEVLAAVEELVAARIFEHERESLYFVHDRLREVAYSLLFDERRRFLHAAVARAMATLYRDVLRDWYGRLAIHFRLADETPAAVRYLVLSAEESTRKYGLDEALASLTTASELAVRLAGAERAQQQVEIALQQAVCLAYLGRMREIAPCLEAQRPRLAELDRPDLSSSFHFWLGFAHNLLGEHEAALRHTTAARALADHAGDVRTGGRARGLLAYEKVYAGEFAEGVELGLQAVEMMTAVQDDLGHVAQAWMGIGLNHMALGDCARALDAFERSERLADQAGATRTLSVCFAVRGLLHSYYDEPEAALAIGRRALELAPDPVSSMIAALMLARTHVAAARYDDALEILENLTAALAAVNMRSAHGLALAVLAEARVHRGDAALGAMLSEQAVTLMRGSEDRHTLGFALRIASECAASVGRHAEAREILAEALTIFQSIRAGYDLAQAGLSAAWIAIAEGDRNAAREALLGAAELFAELGLSARAQHAALRARPAELEREISAARRVSAPIGCET